MLELRHFAVISPYDEPSPAVAGHPNSTPTAQLRVHGAPPNSELQKARAQLERVMGVGRRIVWTDASSIGTGNRA